uniref:Uncharacterized protein n=1 Tax=Anguilla anguilla TaxID=7936 RepID=A0A0E9R817_ANGAN
MYLIVQKNSETRSSAFKLVASQLGIPRSIIRANQRCTRSNVTHVTSITI